MSIVGVVMRRFSVLFLSLVLFTVGGCTDSTDFNGNGSTEVTEISSAEDTLQISEKVVFYFDFNFDENDVFFAGGIVNLVVLLPPQLGYLLDSAEIDGLGGGDVSVLPYITRCRSGFTFLQFNLDDEDLESAYSPTENAEARLSMTLVGRQRSDYVVVEAAAAEDFIAFGCNQDFVSDTAEVVMVF